MQETNLPTRRTIVKASGGAMALGLLAGCTDDGNGDDGNGDDGNGGDGNGGGDVDPSEWEDVDTIEFEAYTQGWEGVSPSPIEGEENPTIVMFEGESYTLSWTNGDGAGHNIEVRDDSDEVVDDLSTEQESGDDVEQELEIDEATDEFAEYVCQPHETQMRGEIQIETNGGGGDGGDDGDENATDENATDDGMNNESDGGGGNESDE